MSDDEGFANDIKTEMVEVNFIPLFPPKQYKPKLYINHLKLQRQKLTPQQGVFINQELQGELTSKFLNLHQEKIVFSENGNVGERQHKSLSFESGFEGGNLEYVVEENKQHHLYIRPDTNTKAHHQWFYFMVKNKSVKQATLVIHNFNKSSMLYIQGLKPYYKSLKERFPYYQQISSNVVYEEDECQEGETKYCLTFKFEFKHIFDEVQFCCQPPYTCFRLNTLLISIPFKKIEISRSVLGQKIQAILVNEQKHTKATVVVMARQHPGESVASWMMEGFINRLQQLESNIFWIIIPMVNMDGVKLGNNRTGILGHDFNRNWNVDEESLRYQLFPELMGIIRYFKRCKKEKLKRIKMFIDLHGHSSQPNVFAYGPPLPQESQYFQNSRLFPYMLSQANSNFNLRQCSYDIDISKKNCARSVFFNRLGFPYSYTIESSFGIYNQKNINQLDMLKMGEDVCQVTLNFVNLLIFKKNEEKLKEMIDVVRRSGLDLYNAHHSQNSDSDYDQNEPQRIEFEKKVTSLLADPNFQQKEVKRLQLQKVHSERQNKVLPRVNIHENGSPRKERMTVQQRVKTEDIKHDAAKSDRQEGGRRSSLHLPSINGLQIFEGLRKRPRQSSQLPKNLSLREITERLLTFKHNKIGRRILILNDYPSSSV